MALISTIEQFGKDNSEIDTTIVGEIVGKVTEPQRPILSETAHDFLPPQGDTRCEFEKFYFGTITAYGKSSLRSPSLRQYMHHSDPIMYLPN